MIKLSPTILNTQLKTTVFCSPQVKVYCLFLLFSSEFLSTAHLNYLKVF